MPTRSSRLTDEASAAEEHERWQGLNGRNASVTTVRPDDAQNADALDRRKLEKAYGPAPTVVNGSRSPLEEEGTISDVHSRSEHKAMGEIKGSRRDWRQRARSPWFSSLTMIVAVAAAVLITGSIIHAFLTRQLDPRGCDMCWSRPVYIKFSDFDTEHTRFASKYNLYMIREGGFDEDAKVKGIPILFIPGNAGSFKQARCLEFEAAQYYHNVIQQAPDAPEHRGKASLDFFSVDFNEDFSAFHGQTLLDQAEYVNDAVAYILSLYHDPRRVQRDPSLPDPSSVILIGHSMGGVVARAMLAATNYQSNSVNTIITMSAPHARAPVSVDSDLVHAYESINEYWRQAHSQRWASDNPLWHVTLISIAGGGLDTVVPSDYASVESLMPDTHGLTVFTSGIPNVWTGCDHIQTTWCVQLMKTIARSIFDTLDVHRSSQTKPRADRMRTLKRCYLTGMENIVEKSLQLQDLAVFVPQEDSPFIVLPPGERLVLRDVGQLESHRSFLMPIPKDDPNSPMTLSYLSERPLGGENAPVDVLFCRDTHFSSGHLGSAFAADKRDLSTAVPGHPRMMCKNAAVDAVLLPASNFLSTNAFDKAESLTYLNYPLSQLAEFSYFAVIEKAATAHNSWVIAEFYNAAESTIRTDITFNRLLTFGLQLKLLNERPMVNEIQMPVLQSSLLAFKLDLGPQICGEDAELFTPLLRQHLEDPYESKYFVNVKNANISLHGISPYMPPALNSPDATRSFSLQFWSDPTCNSSISVSLQLDVSGSLGKLVMRYRLIFAAFPLFIVALVLRKQFQIYDSTGTFLAFSESLDLCLRSSIPLSVSALSVLAVSFASADTGSAGTDSQGILGLSNNSTGLAINFARNDLLLGSQDALFWFLVPLFALISVGACILINYAVMIITHLLHLPYSYIINRPSWIRLEDLRGRTIAPGFSVSSPRRRIITTCILLFLVSTCIPYQFAFLDAVLVQLLTCIRALRLVTVSNSSTHQNFYNYSHSILILMFWVLPINLPVLIVWIHNLAVHWLTPFSTHHNIISIMPYLVLVETLTCGRMIPRLGGSVGRHVTNVLFFVLAIGASVYGVSYAYLLHHLVNGICAWLVAIHLWGNGGINAKSMRDAWSGSDSDDASDLKKQP